jgi:hypothetical protein
VIPRWVGFPIVNRVLFCTMTSSQISFIYMSAIAPPGLGRECAFLPPGRVHIPPLHACASEAALFVSGRRNMHVHVSTFRLRMPMCISQTTISSRCVTCVALHSGAENHECIIGRCLLPPFSPTGPTTTPLHSYVPLKPPQGTLGVILHGDPPVTRLSAVITYYTKEWRILLQDS